jgi:hypothetical protein
MHQLRLRTAEWIEDDGTTLAAVLDGIGDEISGLDGRVKF